MIEKQFVFPEYYINKVPKCDDCKNVILQDTGIRLTSYPPQIVLRCPNCNREYTHYEHELRGEWKWRAI